MGDTNTAQPLTLDLFGSGAPGPVKPCCNSVKGEWKVIPHPTLEGLEYLGPGGVYATYYLKVIPKGYKVTARVRVNGRIKGTLVCKCMDDGRTMSETAVDEPISFDTEIPVFSQNIAKKLIPGIGWVMLAIDVARAAKKAYDLVTLSPELTQMVLENAGPAVSRAVEEVTSSSDTLCQNKHHQKCPPPDPGALDGLPMV